MKLFIHDYCSSPICVFIVHLQQHSDIYHLLNHNNANFFKSILYKSGFFFENKSFVEGDLRLKAWYDIVLTVCTNVGQCGLDFTKVNIMYRKMINLFTSQPEKWKNLILILLFVPFVWYHYGVLRGTRCRRVGACLVPVFRNCFLGVLRKNKL